MLLAKTIVFFALQFLLWNRYHETSGELLSCSDQFDDKSRNTQYTCPKEDCRSGTVYGSQDYTSDSPICQAARHDGRIFPWSDEASDRTVTFQKCRPASKSKYIASFRYGGHFSTGYFRSWPCFKFTSPRKNETLYHITTLSEMGKDFIKLHGGHKVHLASGGAAATAYITNTGAPTEDSLYEKGQNKYLKFTSPKISNYSCYLIALKGAKRNLYSNVIATTGSPRGYTFTKRVNVGESVTLEVNANDDSDIRWFKDNKGFSRDRSHIKDWDGMIQKINSVDIGHGGRYMMKKGNIPYGAIRLIVRVCPAGKYGDRCLLECPTCHYGGVCHDVTGRCVCPPGFMGHDCSLACNENRIGSDCSFWCSDDDGLNSCRGKFVCTIDPYGCSCAVGYHGILCHEECARLNNPVVVLNRRPSDLMVQWKNWTRERDHGSGQVQKYILEMKTGATGQWAFHSETTIENDPFITQTITGLDPCATYYVRVRIQLASGHIGKPSLETEITPYPISVQNLEAKEVNAAITVSWTASSEKYCTVPTGFQWRYQLVSRGHCNATGQQAKQWMTVGRNTSEVILSEIIPYSIYLITVRPVVPSLPGDMTSVTVRTKEAALSVKPAFTSSASTHSLQLTITETSCQLKKGIVTKYEFTIINNGSSCSTARVHKTGNFTELSTTIAGLLPSNAYMIKVRAYTSVGPGPWSDGVLMSTLEEGLPSVSQLSATEMASSLLVTWSAPRDNGCQLSGFYLRSQLVSRGQCNTLQLQPEEWQRVDENTFNISIQGVFAHSLYTVSIKPKGYTLFGEVVNVTIKTKERAPGKITVENVYSETRSLQLSVGELDCQDRNGVITQYEYAVFNNGGSCASARTNKIGNFTDLSTTIMGLVPHTSYTVRARAYTIAGPGPWSDDVVADTLEEGLPSVPLLQAREYEKSLMITWSTLADDGCQLSGFYWRYQLVSRGQCNNTLQIPEEWKLVDKSTLNITIKDVFADSTYKIAVKPKGDTLFGEARNVTVTTKERVPGKIVFTADSLRPRILHVGVTELDCNERHGDITTYEYMVFNRACACSSARVSRSVNFTALSTTITGLAPDSVYAVRVRAYTSAGPGLWSDDVTIKTAVEEPSGNITFSLVSSDARSLQLEVSELSCEDRNGIILNYEYSVFNNGSQCASASIDTTKNFTDLSVNISGLFPHNFYVVRVRAYTIAGHGPWSAAMTIATVEEALPSVLLLHVKETDSSLEVTWSTPSDVGCQLTGFYWRYQLVSRGQCANTSQPPMEWKHVDMNRLNVSMYHLFAHSTYVIDVKPKGASLFGAVETYHITTREKEPENVTLIPISSTTRSVSIFVNQLDCQKRNLPSGISSTSSHYLRILPHSTYIIFINPRGTSLSGIVKSVNVTTKQRKPSGNITFSLVSSDARSLQLKVIELSCEDRNGIILNYEYSVFNNGSQCASASINTTKNFTDLSVNISGLVPYNCYVVRVRAYAIAGHGPWSAAMTIATIEEALPSVLLLHVKETDSSLEVTWSTPSDVGCQLTGFYWRYQLVSRGQCANTSQPPMEWKHVDMNRLNVSIYHVFAHSTYVMDIKPKGASLFGAVETYHITTREKEPENVTLIPISSTTRSVSIFVNELDCQKRNGVIIKYEYSISNDGISCDSATLNRTGFFNASLTAFNGLVPSNAYVTRVRAYTSAGPGSWSEAVTSHTKEEVLGPVSNLTAEENESEVTITWQAPPDDGCQLIGFQWRYLLLQLGQCNYSLEIPSKWNSVDEITLSASISGISAHSTYIIFMKPRGSSLPGIVESVNVTTKQREPSGNVTFSVVSSEARSLQLEVSELSCEDRNGIILNYEYSVFNNGSQCASASINTTKNFTDLSVNISGLVPHNSYVVRVRAYTIAGHGPWSTAMTVATVEEVLPMVANLNVSESSSTLKISWSAPEDDGCQLAGFYWRLQLRSRAQCTNTTAPAEEWTFVNKSTLRASVENVFAYSTYAVHVKPKGHVLVGAERNVKVATSQKAPTGRPALTVLNVTSRSASLVWNSPTCVQQNGIIIKFNYKVFTLKPDCPSANRNNESSVDNLVTHAFVELAPWTYYIVGVQACTIAGCSNWDEKVVKTMENQLNPVHNITIHQISQALRIEWNPPDDSGCQLQGYEWSFKVLSRARCPRSNIRQTSWKTENETMAIIPNIYNFSDYEVSIRSVGPTLKGVVSTVTLTTSQTAPAAPPRNVTLIEITNSSATFVWEQVECLRVNGIVTAYGFQLYSTDLVSDVTSEESDSRDFCFTGLKPYTKYSFRVRALVGNMAGPWSHETNFTTHQSVPSKPASLRCSETMSNSSITIFWSAPANSNGILEAYKIQWSLDEAFHNHKIRTNLDNLSSKLANLKPGRSYQIFVSGKTSVGYGPNTEIVCWTALSDVPRLQLDDIQKDRVTEHTVKVHIHAPSNYLNKESIRYYLIVVERVPPVTRRRRSAKIESASLTGYHETRARKDVNKQYRYISANLTELDDGFDFTIGDGKTYGMYKNQKLETGKFYRFFFGFVIENNVERKEHFQMFKVENSVEEVPLEVRNYKEERKIATIGGAAGGLMIILIVTVGIVLYLRRQRLKQHLSSEELQLQNRATTEVTQKGSAAISALTSDCATINQSGKEKKKTSTESSSSDAHETTKTELVNLNNPISIDDLDTYVTSRLADDSLNEEYKFLPHGHIFPRTAATIVDNKKKNRFTNILPYDKNRVVLEAMPSEPHSDYINASYIDGYKKPRAFIAAMGPNRHTVNDFWRLIWQKNITRVVMLTKTTEGDKKKCEEYWPDSHEVERYGHINVTLTSKETQHDYVTRTFEVLNVYGPSLNKPRELIHYHFTGWPDHGVPTNSSNLWKFYGIVKERIVEDGDDNPTVIHCSAGVGRSGTFIMMDILSEQARVENFVDILGHVYLLRQQRVNMVQTVHQYKFIHTAILESVYGGETFIPTPQYESTLLELFADEQERKNSPLKKEFETARRLCLTSDPEDYWAGKLPNNASKNRFSVLPIGRARPYLVTSGNVDETDYINAVFVNGFKHRDEFIVTQTPLPNTVLDFWRMMNDHNSSTIVMLNANTDGDKSCAQYWPEIDTVQHGHFSVDFLSKRYEHNELIIERSFSLTNTSKPNNPSRQIKQFELINWPKNQLTPTSSTQSALIKLYSLLKDQQHKTDNTPITIHCLDGCTRSGYFCAMVNLFDKIIAEQGVDVFHTVKCVRSNRPEFIAEFEQYKSLYLMAQRFLDSFETYANFK